MEVGPDRVHAQDAFRSVFTVVAIPGNHRSKGGRSGTEPRPPGVVLEACDEETLAQEIRLNCDRADQPLPGSAFGRDIEDTETLALFAVPG